MSLIPYFRIDKWLIWVKVCPYITRGTRTNKVCGVVIHLVKVHMMNMQCVSVFFLSNATSLTSIPVSFSYKTLKRLGELFPVGKDRYSASPMGVFSHWRKWLSCGVLPFFESSFFPVGIMPMCISNRSTKFPDGGNQRSTPTLTRDFLHFVYLRLSPFPVFSLAFSRGQRLFAPAIPCRFVAFCSTLFMPLEVGANIAVCVKWGKLFPATTTAFNLWHSVYFLLAILSPFPSPFGRVHNGFSLS